MHSNVQGHRMRLSFPNGEHPDVLLESGELSIGSAPGNRVSLPDSGLAARHVGIRVDGQRGILMSVLDRSAQVHVNARPVRELAMLRLGDVLSLDRLQVLVKPDDDAVIVAAIPSDSRPLNGSAQRTAASRVVLRGVSGAYHGRSLSLQDPLLVGRGAEADIRLDEPGMGERHAQLELHGERVLLRDLGSHEGSVVNGVAVSSAVLAPGDQIAFDGHRFVLEAPGLPPRGSGALPAGSGMGTTQTMQAVRAEPAGSGRTGEPRASEAPKAHYGWLIVTALVIAGAIVGLLMYAPR
jgi:pSer/pThr/pTyr-binding forkhead associated (FHA) protein